MLHVCIECGAPCYVTEAGISYHVFPDQAPAPFEEEVPCRIDYDTDRDHTAIPELED